MPRVTASDSPCPRCNRFERDGLVCAWCGWRPPCPECDGIVTGRRDKEFCGPSCRKANHRRQAPATREQVVAFLASAPAGKARSAVREAWESRNPEGGRLKLRFGPYHPNK